MKEPNLVTPELLALRLVPPDIRQARYAVPLQAPLQRRPQQMRDGRLKGVETVVQRQQRMMPECDNRHFVGPGQNR